MPGRTLRIRPPARVTLLTRAGDSILEIVLGSIQSCAPGRCTALKFRAAGVSGALRPTLHLSKKPDAEARGVVNDSEIMGGVKGVDQSCTGNLGHWIMGQFCFGTCHSQPLSGAATTAIRGCEAVQEPGAAGAAGAAAAAAAAAS
jgi:hypothetical protein